MRMVMTAGILGMVLLGCATVNLHNATAAAEHTDAAPAKESRWVTGEGTVLKAEPSAASADLAPVALGTQVTIVENAGRWLKVESPTGEKGWIFAGRLAQTPPVIEVVAGNDLLSSVAQNSQIDVAKADSARSIRGLSAETDQYAKAKGTPEEYKKALNQILDRKVSKEELTAFLREGNLGEYAK